MTEWLQDIECTGNVGREAYEGHFFFSGMQQIIKNKVFKAA